MGFAIPSQLAKPIINTLMKDGKVEHARIGVSISDVTPENATFFHLNNASGALISQVDPDSPGAKAGLKVGDVITQLNGKKVEDAGQLQAKVVQEKPGSKLELGIIRDGKTQIVPVTLAAMNPKPGAGAESASSHGKARWGIGLMDVTPEVRDQLQLPNNVKGAVVANVQPGSPADNAGLSRGDVIEEVNRHQVNSSEDAKRELSTVPAGKDALVLVWSNGGSTFRVMHAAEASANQSGD
jgi:serine protease Do